MSDFWAWVGKIADLAQGTNDGYRSEYRVTGEVVVKKDRLRVWAKPQGISTYGE
jgi:hypothetical protein